MNKKRINRLIIIIILILIINIAYFRFIKGIFTKENLVKNNNYIEKINYDDIWIDPNKYEKIEEFLSDKDIFSDLDVNVSKDNFVICRKNKDWNMSYTPFYQMDIRNWYFSNKAIKNAAIVDIYKSNKNGCIFWWYWSESWNKIVFEQDIAHKDTYILNSVFSKKNNVNDIIGELERVPNQSISKKELLSYLYDLKWEYSKANTKRENTCKQNSITCDKKGNFNLNWKVLDESGKPLKDVKITLLNNDNIFTTSDEKGDYSLDFKYYPFSHLRFKASLKEYSDWFQTVSFNNYYDIDWDKKENLNFVLNKSDYSYVVDINSYKNKVSKNWKEYFRFTTKQSTYLVPIDWLYFKNLDKWDQNTFEVYLYELTKWDNTDNLTNIDTFNEVSWYVWNIMKTFWMPYIQFIDKQTGEELFVKKSNPMILQNTIYHMKELYENYDKIYEPITKEDMQFLVSYSKQKWWYPIDFDFLTKNNFLRWPAWWVLDRKKWVWESVGFKVLTIDWLVELPFYSINDK